MCPTVAGGWSWHRHPGGTVTWPSGPLDIPSRPLETTRASSEAKQERKVIATGQEAWGCLYNPMGPRQGALKLGYCGETITRVSPVQVQGDVE